MSAKFAALTAVAVCLSFSSGERLCAAELIDAAAAAQVDALLARMSLSEKIELLHGVPEASTTDQGQAGYISGLARLGIAPLRLADGPPGVLTRYPSTGLTATMGLAATFSRADARANGVVIAHEATALGIDVVLEPYINLDRDPTFARAYNTYGEDPLLTGEIGAALIVGIQSEGVMAQAKHYLAYNGADNPQIEPQALHELYVAPFAAVVEAGVSSIMCSYNRVNGVYSCGNRATLTDILRDELRFEGFVTSDWGATHASSFINEGLDLEMPGAGSAIPSYFEAEPPRDANRRSGGAPVFNLMPEEQTDAQLPLPGPPPARPVTPEPPAMLDAVRAGLVSEAAITRAVRRVLLTRARFGRLTSSNAQRHPDARESSADLARADATVRATAEDAAVLLENRDHALPLKGADLNALALIGPGALQTVAIGNSGEKALGRIERQVGPAAALEALADAEPNLAVHVSTAVADDMSGVAVPAKALSHALGAGLERLSSDGRAVGVDAQLEFTRASGNALPAGAILTWRGSLTLPHAGRYRLYLQALGASAELALDGRLVASTGPLALHGNVLQPGQDNLLPSRDGLDNVRREFELGAGAHALSVQVHGDASGEPLQVRLAWVTPEQRRADYQQALTVASAAHTAVVFAWSRGLPVFGLPGDQDQLISDIAARNPNTIVVLNLSQPVAMPWLDRVKAVLLMWYPGDEGGPATADVLLGRVSPAGRLPLTWPRRLEDGVANDPQHPERSSQGVAGRTSFSEGIFIGYRWFDREGLEPLYPFGYGRSYTSFEYRDLALAVASDGGLDASFTLRNVGPAAADEVPQVYLGPPEPEPSGAQFARRALVAFERVHLQIGETRRVRLHIAPRALEYWSSAAQAWRRASGERALMIAASSRDPRLTARAHIGEP